MRLNNYTPHCFRKPQDWAAFYASPISKSFLIFLNEVNEYNLFLSALIISFFHYLLALCILFTDFTIERTNKIVGHF